MRSEEKVLKEAAKGIIKLILLPFSAFDETLVSITPTELREPARHLINARIEFLRALNTLIDVKIKRLERFSEEMKVEEKRKRREKATIE